MHCLWQPVVRLSVFDKLGREVTVLVDETKGAGRYQITFDARGLSTGMYFYRLHARPVDPHNVEEFVHTKRMVLVKEGLSTRSNLNRWWGISCRRAFMRIRMPAGEQLTTLDKRVLPCVYSKTCSKA